jgi:hypothetical protein
MSKFHNGRNALFFKKKLKYMFLMMEKMLIIEITMFHDITRDISAPPPPSNLTLCLPSPLNLKKGNFFRRVFWKTTPITKKIALF